MTFVEQSILKHNEVCDSPVDSKRREAAGRRSAIYRFEPLMELVRV